MRSSDEVRFWSFVEVRGVNECWPWRGGRSSNGYGVFWLEGGCIGAHVVSLALSLGRPLDLSAKEQGCHDCDNPPCCNPYHVYAGTQKDNQQDAVRRGRKRPNPPRGSKNPHAKLTEDKVATIRSAYAAGGCTHRSLAALYGVSHVTIRYVLHGDAWRHVGAGSPS